MQDRTKIFEQAAGELNAAIKHAFNRGDTAACAEAYAEDAVLYVPGRPPLKGRNEIRALLEEWSSLGMKLESVEVLEVRASGDMGYCAGTYEFRVSPSDDGSGRNKGKFVTDFMKRPDGSWKATVDCLTDG